MTKNSMLLFEMTQTLLLMLNSLDSFWMIIEFYVVREIHCRESSLVGRVLGEAYTFNQGLSQKINWKSPVDIR